MGLSKRKHRYQKEIVLGDLSKVAERVIFNSPDTIKEICSFENVNDKGLSWTYLILADEKDAEEEGVYTLSVKTEKVELEETELETPVSRTDIEKFPYELLNALSNEYKKGIKERILARLLSKPINSQFSIKKIEQKRPFFRIILEKLRLMKPKLEKPNFNETLSTITRCIVSASNSIAHNGRIGPANTIICGPGLAALLQDSNAFVYSSVNTVSQICGLYKIGQFAGHIVYIDPYIDFNDKRMIVGRFSQDVYGVKLFFKPDLTKCLFLTEGVQAHKAVLKVQDKLMFPENFDRQYEVCDFDIDLI